MDATSLVTPSDTHKSIKKTHIFMIVNAIIIFLALGGTVGWLFYARSKKIYPFKPYVRNTGPPGTVKVSNPSTTSSTTTS